ncbi:MAG: glutamine-hydrolyzing GMP synthase [Pseudomonadota bacterium]
MILILDYGSQTTQLIARRIREKKVFSKILRFDAELGAEKARTEGIVLSGGPASVYVGGAPALPGEILDWAVPILGICYGAQLLAHTLGGRVGKASSREFGRADIRISDLSDLFSGVAKDSKERVSVWMSHGDRIERMPEGFDSIAASFDSPFAAIRHRKKRIYGLQFHPEVTHTACGNRLLENFLFRICKAKPDWTMDHFVSAEIETIRKRVGKKHVLAAVSGGVDSSVLALLLHKALGRRLTAIFVDTGLLRKNERKNVEESLRRHFRVDLRVVNASVRFLDALKDVEDPERKRKIIGRLFIDVFDREARRIRGAAFLAQGTLYPDVIESAAHMGPSATIKSHHNVGGLPEKMNLELIEPFRELFKDEVREVGRELGLDESLISRHPFPGPGLAVRILGAVTEKHIRLLQEADAIFIEELRNAGLYHEVWQAFAVLLPVRSVGVMGDGRTYENVCALRAVTSSDGMTAEWARLPFDLLARISGRITNEVRGINRVVYDVSSKPPATIEWE